MYDGLMIRPIILIYDRWVGCIRNGKDYFQSHKEDNQTHSDDSNDSPFYSRHHVPLFSNHPTMPTPLLQMARIQANRRLVLLDEQPDHLAPWACSGIAIEN
jgi:hypothetical protein